jgi:hypothetical protein
MRALSDSVLSSPQSRTEQCAAMHTGLRPEHMSRTQPARVHPNPLESGTALSDVAGSDMGAGRDLGRKVRYARPVETAAEDSLAWPIGPVYAASARADTVACGQCVVYGA